MQGNAAYLKTSDGIYIRVVPESKGHQNQRPLASDFSLPLLLSASIIQTQPTSIIPLTIHLHALIL